MYFFVEDLKSGLVFGSPQTDHFFVMRVKIGENLNLTDLAGNVAQVKICELDKKKRFVKYEILNIEKKKNGLDKILIQAKTDKNYLEKMMEILPLCGVTKIIIFNSDRSNLAIKINIERLEKILIRACEQGEISYKPELIFNDGVVESILKTQQNPSVLDFPESYPHVDNLSTAINKSCLLVGPEGGWSDKEKQIFIEKKLPIISLGRSVFPAWLAGYTFFIK